MGRDLDWDLRQRSNKEANVVKLSQSVMMSFDTFVIWATRKTVKIIEKAIVATRHILSESFSSVCPLPGVPKDLL